jgi:signal transduction histidine kinase
MNDRLIEVFLAKVAHELRNPANAIAAWVLVLRQSRPDDEVLTRGLETIDRNVRLQVRILDDMLDIASVAAGKVSLLIEHTDLAEVVASAVETIRPEAETHGLTVTAYPSETRAVVLADRSRMQQVFGNILTNAIKYTPPGGRIDVRCAVDGDSVSVSIADTGRGISRENLDAVFDLFHQGPVDPSAHHTYGGLGIGLALVRQLVELHDGRVTAESHGDGHGATFVVTMPLVVSS